MSYNKSWNAYTEFAHRIKFENRHILDSESLKFLDALVANSDDRKKTIKAGTILWRAQLGNGWREEIVRDDQGEVIESFDLPTCFSPDRMKPLPNKAREGRINPKGISCLYLSNEKDTAMSEVRPWIGGAISLSQFRVNRDLTVVDFSKHHDRDPFYGFRLSDEDPEPEPQPDEHIDILWTSVDRAFSNPVRSDDNTASYAPTQVIAERFRKERFDGVVYKSPFGKGGYNIALFDIDSATLKNGFLYKAASMNIIFEETANPYFVTSKDDISEK